MGVRLTPHNLGGGMRRSATQCQLLASGEHLSGSTPPGNEQASAPALLKLSPWRRSGAPAFLLQDEDVSEAHVQLSRSVPHLGGFSMMLQAEEASGAAPHRFAPAFAGAGADTATPPRTIKAANYELSTRIARVATLSRDAGGSEGEDEEDYEAAASPPPFDDDSPHELSGQNINAQSPSSAWPQAQAAAQNEMLSRRSAPTAQRDAISSLSRGLSEAQLYGGFDDDTWDPLHTPPRHTSGGDIAHAAMGQHSSGGYDADVPLVSHPERLVLRYEPRAVRRRTSYAADDPDGDGGWIQREEGSSEWEEANTADQGMAPARTPRGVSADDAYGVW
jgi:hypothetical protein